MTDVLISRQQAIDAIDRIFDRCEEIEAHLPEDDPDRTGYKMFPDYMIVWKYLHQLPSAQPEIIRCKDCKHHWIHRCMDSMPTEICDLNQSFYDPYIDFCSLAERRTDEQTD